MDPSVAEQTDEAIEGGSGVGVLDKVAAIFTALEGGPLPLASLSEATGLPRATAHRLATALERHGLVGRHPGGAFVLGRRLAELGSRVGPSDRRLAELAGPTLARLRELTGESVQLYVPSGGRRVCVASLESPHSLRTIVSVGASLTMEKGSAAKVLRAAPGLLGEGWAESVEERERGVASVSAAVLVGGRAVAAVSVSGPLERLSRSPGRRYGTAVVGAASQLQAILERIER